MITLRTPIALTAGIGAAVLVLALSAAHAQKAAGDALLLPADGFSGAWKKSGPMRVFTSQDLYGHIDGGAEAFLELGYLVLYNTAGGAANASMVVKAAQAISPKLPADVQVAALGLLPAAGLVPGSARIIRGPVGLQALYTLGDGDILQLGGKITAAAGDYQDAAGASTLIVVDYPNPATASAAFRHLKANLDTYLKPTGATDTRQVFQDYEKKFGVASVSGRRLEIRLHLLKAPA